MLLRPGLKNTKGFTIIAAIFIIMVIGLLAIVTANFIASDSVSSVENYNSLKAFYVAEAGSRYYIKQLQLDNDWATPPATTPKSFSNGSFSLVTSGASTDEITIQSTGLVTIGAKTYERKIQSTVNRVEWGFADEYVLYWGGADDGGGGTTQIGSNVYIEGDVLTNSNINLGSNVEISGDAYASGTISGYTAEVSGVAESNSALPSSPPSLETTYYDNLLATAATFPVTNPSWGNKTLNQSSSPYYIHGNLIISNNAVITITDFAMVIVTGTVTISNNVTIGNNLTLIAGGAVTINNNVNIGANCLFYSTPSFTISNNLEMGVFAAGAGTSFITPGDIDIWNNAEMFGFIYAGGTFNVHNNLAFWGNIVAGQVDIINNNSELHLATGLVDLSLINGLSGATQIEIKAWQEIY